MNLVLAKRLSSLILGASFLLAFLAPRDAHAVLGGDPSSISTVVDAIEAQRIEIKPLTGTGLTLTRIQADGLEVREYVAESTERVVGIAWTGMREPKRLAAILGPLMSEYVHSIREARTASRGSGPHARGPASSTRSRHLIIQRFSRMGFSRARVYLSELPSEVSADAIR